MDKALFKSLKGPIERLVQLPFLYPREKTAQRGHLNLHSSPEKISDEALIQSFDLHPRS